MDKVAELVARQEIEDTLLRYARGVDRRDWDAVRKCFHADASDSHGDYSGDPSGFIEWVKNRHASVPFAMHFLGNCLVEFQCENEALVETYFIAIRRQVRSDEANQGAAIETDVEIFGRYCDRFEKRDQSWRIAERQVVYDSSRIQPSSHRPDRLVGTFGSRDKSDPVYALGKTSKLKQSHNA